MHLIIWILSELVVVPLFRVAGRYMYPKFYRPLLIILLILNKSFWPESTLLKEFISRRKRAVRVSPRPPLFVLSLPAAAKPPLLTPLSATHSKNY